MNKNKYLQPYIEIFDKIKNDIIMASDQKIEDIWIHDVIEGGSF